MKVAQITPYFLPHNGGMEMYVYNLSRSLIDDGHTVEVITANVPEGRPLEVMDGILVRRLRCIGEPLRNPLVPSIFFLLNELKKFDVIHIHNLYSFTALTFPLLKKFCKIPLVLTHHGQLMFGEPMKDVCVRLYEKSAKGVILDSVDKTVALSESDARHIALRNNAPARRYTSAAPRSVVTIPNGYNGTKFRPMDTGECRKKLGLPSDKKVILNVGRLYGAVKGHEYLIEAMSRIVNEQRDVLCVIVGAGRLHGTLENRIRSLGLEDYVVLAGGRPHDEIPFWLNACDLFVLPSLSEGNPTVMFEAFGCGKPFVGTSVGGVPEVITSDEYGLLVDPADSSGLAGAILEALDRDWDGEAIRAFSERYTWENISREIVDVYGQVRL
ncbi:glycosyltransferase family 4 protein [Methanoculleus sp. YWC-01]|jgi:glycosyltransferase involved in cell wall biosynthesis|uniref:Glycosyltransferase family 4 protein n=1 Tax=Methanoculleus nereidis TaxID=2735141 RepID=A0ABU3Z3Q3_9EURY|nr:glycosyltransferase family 4 protein [Methanoculleus sp. YWC-01]MDV4343444.1 glycosyltransferase family 4 protein [Methanoculleus sp. YWC-01]PKL57035.1 MAG: glycosyltransferase family 4 protein [Methanomicrobiales archaeon HGW-Methanomicrobiales-6]